MANPSWPTTLPDIQYPGASSGYHRTADSGVIHTKMDAGPVKMRRRFTAVRETVDLQIDMTSGQLADLKTFYRDTLSKVLPFDWIDHYTREPATYRFVSPYTVTPLATDMWKVGLSLELMP